MVVSVEVFAGYRIVRQLGSGRPALRLSEGSPTSEQLRNRPPLFNDHLFSPIILFGTEVPTAAVARAHPLFRWIAMNCGGSDLRAELLLGDGVAIPAGAAMMTPTSYAADAPAVDAHKTPSIVG